MDAIESGIVKLPRVPVADNIPNSEMPTFRNLWHHIGKKMPKKGRGKAASLDPLSIPYDLNEENLFDVEYTDVLGIPFDFTARPVVAPPQPPRETVQVRVLSPERDACEIRFPRVQGYRVNLHYYQTRIFGSQEGEDHERKSTARSGVGPAPG